MGLKNSIARNLRNPSTGFVARMVIKVFKQQNAYMERNAVRLCRLEPHHHVLEVGFGPGVGLKAAAEAIVDGKVYGIDYSEEMVKEAQGYLDSEIASGKVQVDLGDAASLPYPDTSMDRIFHCNCYYFWPDQAKVARELHCVLKPGGFMVTVLPLELVRRSAAQGYLPGANWEPEPYMEALRRAELSDVTMEDMVCTDGQTEKTCQAIFAYKK
ncbi:uncharacterized protein LOC110991207 isoform X2 [Acanthaster planci]|uniref:Uncharacterized protein LOC110991207 isoform X2 n=1 Tax=Acanthaster planci TaxID=133434 RepID=A0A8B8A7X9_ACAPL|nr:uncharacterized protein LOC110991207 isoform X2 [Acanthaster planci]